MKKLGVVRGDRKTARPAQGWQRKPSKTKTEGINGVYRFKFVGQVSTNVDLLITL